MKILLVGYDPNEHSEEEFYNLTPEEIKNLDGDLCIREYDFTNPTFSQIDCIVSDVQSWTEHGGLTYIKEIK